MAEQRLSDGRAPIEDPALARLEQLEREHRSCERRIAALEQQNSQLLHLNVASQRLHETMTRRDVLCAIEEIVMNLIGSEQVAVFEVIDEQMILLVSSGVDEKRLAGVRYGEGIIGDAAVTGTPWIAPQRGEAAASALGHLTAVIPLKVRDSVIGVVAVFRLLQQKRGLEPLDHDIFELLGRQGAVALYCTSFDSTRPTARPPSVSKVRLS